MKVSVPLFVSLPRKRTVDKRIHLNLNVYRNTHYQVLNDAKEIYKEIIRGVAAESGLLVLSERPPYEITYTYYPPNKRKCDLGNVLPVVQKFCEDSLVELGLIEDDNYTIVNSIRYRFGEVDKDNPRVEIEVCENR